MKSSLLLLTSILFFACSDSQPAGVLSKEKMQEVLYDISLADELVELSSLTDSTYRGNKKRYALYDSVFRIHGITKQTYTKSQEWYQANPELLKPLLEAVRDKTDTTKKPKPIPVQKQV